MSVSDSSANRIPNYELLDPDVRLMLQVRQGNAAAYEELVKKHERRVIGFLEHMVSPDQAEDLAQEVFLRVFRARENYEPGARFATWLFTIMHNVASNSLRKKSRNMEVQLHGDAQTSGAMSIEQLALSASGQMPTRQLDRRELQDIVRFAIQSLNERQRMVVLMSKFEGMSYQEIGEALDLTPQAVKSLVSRARNNLKDILAPYVKAGILPGVSLIEDNDEIKGQNDE
ncbi:MAG: sigma-70 family RNA polymerase sigma factor [Pirellulaceae bacterium]|nr:sigma-70 family RNA polymerase sigma factor [Pirellulaceae bacterium]